MRKNSEIQIAFANNTHAPIPTITVFMFAYSDKYYYGDFLSAALYILEIAKISKGIPSPFDNPEISELSQRMKSKGIFVYLSISFPSETASDVFVQDCLDCIKEIVALASYTSLNSEKSEEFNNKSDENEDDEDYCEDGDYADDEFDDYGYDSADDDTDDYENF